MLHVRQTGVHARSPMPLDTMPLLCLPCTLYPQKEETEANKEKITRREGFVWSSRKHTDTDKKMTYPCTPVSHPYIFLSFLQDADLALSSKRFWIFGI